jgi:fucose permease
MWDTRAAAPLNLVNLGYGLGAILANLLVRPFLNNNPHTNSTVSIPLNSDIRVPYLITAALSLVIGMGHFIFFLRGKKAKVEEQKVDHIFHQVFFSSENVFFRSTMYQLVHFHVKTVFIQMK